MKIPAEAPEGSVLFRRVPVQIPCEVSGGPEDTKLYNTIVEVPARLNLK